MLYAFDWREKSNQQMNQRTDHTVAQTRIKTLSGAVRQLEAKLYPNGECVVYRTRTFKPTPLKSPYITQQGHENLLLFRTLIRTAEGVQLLPLLLGLSHLPIFDKPLERDVIDDVKGRLKPRAPKGLKGLTSRAKRTVRNAAHLIEKRYGRARSVFATATMPALPVEQLRVLHENWGKVVEIYRLGLRRTLQKEGLRGEIVTVSEIQPKRHKNTGLPVLHIHSIFCGVTRTGKFALTPKKHDDLWYNALSALIDIERNEIASSCNLQRVKKSASGYMAKYITKGAEAIAEAVASGFSGWLPKHWWNCTRTLSRAVREQTRRVDDFAEHLCSMANAEGVNCWKWHKEFFLEDEHGNKTSMAIYGQLENRAMAEIQAYYKPNG